MKRFPTLQAEVAAAANEALERFREDGRKTATRLVDMESSYLTVEFFRKLPQEGKGGNPQASAMDRYTEAYLRRIGVTGHTPRHYLYHILFAAPCEYLLLSR